jgi:hypothetical protein
MTRYFLRFVRPHLPQSPNLFFCGHESFYFECEIFYNGGFDLFFFLFSLNTLPCLDLYIIHWYIFKIYNFKILNIDCFYFATHLLTSHLAAHLAAHLTANGTSDLHAHLTAHLHAHLTAHLASYSSADLETDLTADLTTNLTRLLRGHGSATATACGSTSAGVSASAC